MSEEHCYSVEYSITDGRMPWKQTFSDLTWEEARQRAAHIMMGSAPQNWRAVGCEDSPNGEESRWFGRPSLTIIIRDSHKEALRQAEWARLEKKYEGRWSKVAHRLLVAVGMEVAR